MGWSYSKAPQELITNLIDGYSSTAERYILEYLWMQPAMFFCSMPPPFDTKPNTVNLTCAKASQSNKKCSVVSSYSPHLLHVSTLAKIPILSHELHSASINDLLSSPLQSAFRIFLSIRMRAVKRGLVEPSLHILWPVTPLQPLSFGLKYVFQWSCLKNSGWAKLVR